MDGRWRRRAVAYLVVQTGAVLGWWGWLSAVPGAVRHFVGPRLPAAALKPYLLPDLAIYGLGGLAVATLLHRQHPMAWTGLAALAGAVLYATLSTFALALESQGGWLGVVMMAASLGATLFLTWRLRPR